MSAVLQFLQSSPTPLVAVLFLLILFVLRLRSLKYAGRRIKFEMQLGGSDGLGAREDGTKRK